MTSFSILILIAHYSLVGLLCLFGLHRLSMVFRWFGARHYKPGIPKVFEKLPKITVQIPLYNERLVAKRIVDAVAAFDYPAEQLQIQIVDDSSDETSQLTAERVRHYQLQGINIQHLQRTIRTGFKAGALKEAMDQATGEFIAIFDADFIPEPSLLKETIHHFNQDRMGMIQFRWLHLNRNSSSLTKAQAMMLDSHFSLEQQVRCSSNLFFNFNGTAGVWRTEAIIDAGHWSADTLTEDLDLSYRAQLKGWKMLYLNDHGCAGELPADMAAFKSQQHRWAKGGVQVMKKMLGIVWRSSFSLKHKIESSFHLSNNLAYLVMMIDSVCLLLPSLFARQYLQLETNLWVDLPMLMLASASHLIYLFFGQVALGRSKTAALMKLPRLLLIGIQLAYNNAKAGVEALRGQESEFVRTPKSGEHLQTGQNKAIQNTSTDTFGLSFYQAVTPKGVAFELMIATVFLMVSIWAVMNQVWLMLPVLLFLMVGFTATAAESFITQIKVRRTSNQAATE